MRRDHAEKLGRSLLVVSLVLGSACGGGTVVAHPGRDGGADDAGGAAPITGLVSLAVTPADLTLRVGPGMPATQLYTAIGTFTDGHREDVTARVAFYIPGPDAAAGLGSFSGATFSSAGMRGGRTTVSARAGSILGTTTLTLLMTATVVVAPGSGPAVPAHPDTLFGGTVDATRAPSLVYPNDGVVLPPNLGRIEIHWLEGDPGNTLFDVSFTNTTTDVHAYVRCETPTGITPDGCIWEAGGDAWTYVASTNAGGAPVTITVRGTTDAGGAVGVSTTRTERFSLDRLDGTIYYWTTSADTAIMRYDFGAASGTAQHVMGPAQTQDGMCVGCHALSHDGRKIVGSVGGQNAGGMVLIDLETSSTLANRSMTDDHIEQFASFSPDGSRMVAVYGDDTASPALHQLLFFDTQCDAATMGTCGTQVAELDLGNEASHPSWSPDGTHIAFTDVGHHHTSQKPGWGAIRMVDLAGSGWSAPRDLVPRADGLNRYNPDFAPVPMSNFLVYDESTCPGGDVGDANCDGDSDLSSKIWAVPLAGGTPVLLARAMSPGTLDMGHPDLQASFPRFAPFVFTLSNGDLGPTSLMWITFASRRHYGLRTPGALGDTRSTWLWMVAIDPAKVARGEDPSFSAFCLPFQAIDTSNHIGVWTTTAVGDGILH